jgi:hypothetical protein
MIRHRLANLDPLREETQNAVQVRDLTESLGGYPALK